MKLSIAETATILGKSDRQVRYMIKTGRLKATMTGSRWRIDSADLPLTDAQRQALAERSQAARRAFEKGLEPAAKAALTAPAKGAASEETKRRYSVTDLFAFQAGEAIYREVIRELGRDEPAAHHLFETLALLARGCHAFHPRDKAGRFTEARELAATAVAELLLHDGDGEAEARRGWARRIEQELIPKLAGLVASHEKRSRRSRFDRFGSAVAPGR